MKTPLVAKIKEKRILQLSNDVSEDIKSGTTAEWRAVAIYYREQADAEFRKRLMIQDKARDAAMRMIHEMVNS